MGLAPNRDGGRQQFSASTGQAETAAALVSLVNRDLDQPATLERLQIGGYGRAIHRQQPRNITDSRRLRPIKRHQQRKLAIRQIERAKRLVKPPRYCTRRALKVQTQAVVANQEGDLVTRFFAA